MISAVDDDDPKDVIRNAGTAKAKLHCMICSTNAYDSPIAALCVCVHSIVRDAKICLLSYFDSN